MAKPGSHDARRVANGAGVDLSAAAMSDDQAREEQKKMELLLGFRCAGCEQRIRAGFEFTSLDPRDPQKPVMKLAACARDDCDFAERAREGAHVVEMREFRWLGSPLATPPAAERASRAAE